MTDWAPHSIRRSAGPAASEHPEALLDKARGGQLDDEAWPYLLRHLAQCPPCEAQLRLPGLVHDRRTRASDTHLDRVAVFQALDRLRAGDPARRVRVRRWLPIGAATLLFSGTALATSWWSIRHRAETPAVMAMATPGPSPVNRRAAVVAARASTGAPVSPEGHASLRRSGRDGAIAAAELFALARTQRVEGNTAGALVSYRRLQRGYPDSRESQLSHLVAGRLWLDRDRCDLAARQFSLYLQAGGDGTEEALVGRALAYARLGRASDEAADWSALLSRHPGSVHVGRARSRLAALGQTSGAMTPPRAGH